jgi:hypothetical protein
MTLRSYVLCVQGLQNKRTYTYLRMVASDIEDIWKHDSHSTSGSNLDLKIYWIIATFYIK